jgi:hypothetical protein
MVALTVKPPFSDPLESQCQDEYSTQPGFLQLPIVLECTLRAAAGKSHSRAAMTHLFETVTFPLGFSWLNSVNPIFTNPRTLIDRQACCLSARNVVR